MENSTSSLKERPYRHVKDYPKARTYYLRYPTGNRLATVMLMKDADGRWCRGVSIMSAEKGPGNRYDVNEGRRKAWRRLQASLHKRSNELPIGSAYESSRIFLAATQDIIRFKGGYDVGLTAKEQAIINAAEEPQQGA